MPPTHSTALKTELVLLNLLEKQVPNEWLLVRTITAIVVVSMLSEARDYRCTQDHVMIS